MPATDKNAVEFLEGIKPFVEEASSVFITILHHDPETRQLESNVGFWLSDDEQMFGVKWSTETAKAFERTLDEQIDKKVRIGEMVVSEHTDTPVVTLKNGILNEEVIDDE
jgi:hypothetical protein